MKRCGKCATCRYVLLDGEPWGVAVDEAYPCEGVQTP